ncbi:polysaccharide deacetylase family protein [Legionella quinlivanii]|uniref:polysaccharide deacetylase family protein n=1 Tax=Legionella quinlivanii TaxID=45073 RepID=UPI00224359E1|nr:polysaccharide deacetylase family protein [Legionella quinlivanii]MCW8450288.1 polysaccharide deacetylase family protein [Legionella quinlivanii]
MLRDMVGYGPNLPLNGWPGNTKLAINFVINYEEGAELSPVNGDLTAETYGGEFPLAAKPSGMRNLSMESLFEYGSRCGIWRLIRLFEQEQIPLTFFITGLAIRLNRELGSYLRNTSHEAAGHGWRWIDYAQMSKEEEKKHIIQCINAIKEATGRRPQGWYTGRRSSHTRELLSEIGGFKYDSESYADDLPYFLNGHLIIPYTLDCNDFRYTTNPGFGIWQDFYTHLKASFDYLYQEQRMALMTIGLHPRISGRPGRCLAIQQFIAYIKQFKDVWITRRIDIADFWLNNCLPHKP